MVILRKAWKLGAGGRRWDCGGGGEGSPEAEPGGGRVGEGGGALQAHLTEPVGRAPPAGPIWSLSLLLLEGRGDVREEGKVGREEQEGAPAWHRWCRRARTPPTDQHTTSQVWSKA